MAKKTKSFLPKRIAGVKVPKSVRKGRLGELLASRTGQALIAEALMAAGAVGAAKKTADSPKAQHLMADAADKMKTLGGDAKHKAGDAKDKVEEAGSTFAFALGEAARSFAAALDRHNGIPHDGDLSGASETWTPDYGGPDDGKKKQAAPEAGPLF
ncbi:hypothetical protein DJ021_17325 [Phenylobacterium hankyongense]|uniref:Uncharacterized protein n=1 Tax=Phenylobacterium hankyongense TaxID=1813876 RepID=A0A328B3M4_9CAUL|nr:hypothetical protein [Phenylobacterium hankyongense]RAK61437.1 hypothetical protein DJ021_17325 [Phenylobacterium hankyongense]